MKFDSPRALDEAYERAYNAGDLEGIVALYEPAAKLARPGVWHEGTEAIRAAFVETLRTRGERVVSLRGAETTLAGGVALTSATWNVTDRPGVEPFTWKTLEVSRRQPDGGWLLLIDDPITPNRRG